MTIRDIPSPQPPHLANRYYHTTQIPCAGERADRSNLKNMCTDYGCENCKKTLGTLPKSEKKIGKLYRRHGLFMPFCL